MSLTEYSKTHLPIYPEFAELWSKHEAIHWIPEEVNLSNDVEQWKTKVSPAEKSLIKNILRLFTTSDFVVAAGYLDRIIPHIKNSEARIMLTSFANREAVHIFAYALLSDTLGFEEDFYFEFLDYAEMSEKVEFMIEPSGDSPEEFAKYLARQTLIEGVNLFASFACLLNFDRFGLFPGMTDVVSWSIADEACVDDQTEILTESGWKYFSDLSDVDSVAQYVPVGNRDGDIEFVRPSRIIRKEHKGEMVYLKSRYVDQMLTPDHRVVYYYGDDDDQLRECLAADFVPHTRKRIPVAGHKRDGVRSLSNEDRFKIAFQADGSRSMAANRQGERSGTVRCTFTLKKDRKKDRLESILNALDWTWKYGRANGTAERIDGQRTIYHVDCPVEYAPDKSFDWVDVTNVSDTWCVEFIDELLHWDGWRSDGCCPLYSNTNKDAIDKVSIVATLGGMQSSAVWRSDDRVESYLDCCKLTIFDKANQRMGASGVDKSMVDYDGMVYCVTVPSGAIVIRRNGVISVTGNCHIEGNSMLFKKYVEEHPYIVNDDFKKSVYETAERLVEIEDAFINKSYEFGEVRGLQSSELKEYVRYITNQRLLRLGFKKIFDIEENPIPWIDALQVDSHGSFFERNVVEYSADNLKGTWTY